MATLLVKNAHLIATFDSSERELRDASIFVRDNVIETIGHAAELPQTADTVIDASRCVVTPGLVNTHHHMFQTLTRAIPAAQDAELFAWLKAHYPIWAGITPDMLRTASLTAMAELLLAGCTTSSDHLYLQPGACALDDTIAAAQQIGMRFHAMRGSMSVGESAGGLPPDSMVEQEVVILNDSQRVIEQFHDAGRYAMLRIGLAPCSPFTVSRVLMRESARLARSYVGKGVRLHTHLAENDHDVAYTRERFGCTPAQYAEDLDWLGDDVWHAHCVKLDTEGITRFADTATGMTHCPCSNMRLASGIAPIRKLIDSGVRVGLGVDGSASNDSSHLLNEARQAMLLARVGRSVKAFGCDDNGHVLSARDALRMATRDGAGMLGRDDIGSLAPGMAADIALFRIDTLAMAGGAVHDPIAALMFCATPQAEYTIVNGRVVVHEGQLTTLDLPPHIERHNRMSRQLAEAVHAR